MSLATVGLLAVGLLIAAGAPRAAAEPTVPAAASRWALTDHLALDSSRAATACATATTCWVATGGTLLQTTDLGATWIDRGALVPPDVRGLVDVSCPTSTRCLITTFSDTGAGVLVIDGGTATSRSVPGAPVVALRLDCASESRCLATDGTTAYRTADAGATWASVPLPQSIPEPAVSCAPGTATCVVVGRRGEFDFTPAAARTRDGGASWQALAIPDGYRRQTQFDDVDCLTAAVCRIAGAGHDKALVLTTTDAGIGAVAAVLPRDVYEVVSLSCTAGRTCRGAARGTDGGQRGVTTTDGTHWTSDPLATAYLSEQLDVACGAGTGCVAATIGLVHRTTRPGAWTDVSVPAAIRGITAISCASVAPCNAVGYDAADRPVALHGRPGAWTTHPMPAAVVLPNALDCSSSDVCTALSEHTPSDGTASRARQPWRTVDGGATWTPQSFPEPSTGFNLTVDCPSVTLCLASGFTRNYDPDLLRTVDGGATWTRVGAPGGARDVAGVSCVTAARCVLLGRQDFSAPAVAWRTADVGATFSAASRISPTESDSFRELACATAACVASGYASGASFARSVDRGRTWSLTPPPTATGGSLSQLSCASSGRCVVVAFAFPRADRFLTSPDAGATWRVGALPAGARSAGRTACTDAGCLSVGYDRFGLLVVLVEP